MSEVSRKPAGENTGKRKRRPVGRPRVYNAVTFQGDNGRFSLPLSDAVLWTPGHPGRCLAKTGQHRFCFGDELNTRNYASCRRLSISSLGLAGGCYYCGDHADRWDHVLAERRGGKREVGNMVPCCASCNVIKGYKSLFEFRQWIRKSNEEFGGNQKWDFETPEPYEIKGDFYYFSKTGEPDLYISDDKQTIIKGNQSIWARVYNKDEQ